MSSIKVREFLEKWNRAKDIIEFQESTATVALAAEALRVEPARIGKSLTFRADEGGARLIVVCGDMKIENRKFKLQFGHNPKMLKADEALAFTGFQVGGICPFALPDSLPVYLDASLQRFKSVFLACGDANSLIEVEMPELMEYSGALGWVDVCKGSEADVPRETF